ncbi:hypothetical protein FO519_005135 [Halicephalobus sp. NKZ332]|nr:hypothetical protein FO519_005135 [Halicephalobus sp. NKZ332]
MVFIESLELENFKSFYGYRRIGPFTSTNAIVGANGAGKSNTLDAITFVFGDNAKNTRAGSLQKLIYSEDGKTPKCNSCYVQIRITVPESEKIKTFKRVVKKSGGEEYYFNDGKRTKNEYMEIVESYGIFARNENFVIRQETISKMTDDSDDYRTKFIDIVSGGIKYVEDCKQFQLSYDEVLKEVRTHQEECKKTGQEVQKLTIASNKRKDLEEDNRRLNMARIAYYLTKLYPLEKKLEESEEKYRRSREKLQKSVTGSADEVVALEARIKTDLTTLVRKTKVAKSKESAAAQEDAKAKQDFDKYCEKISVAEKKLETTEKMCRALEQKSQERHQGEITLNEKIRKLEAELASLVKEASQSMKGVAPEDMEEFRQLQANFEEDKINKDAIELEGKVRRVRAEWASVKGILGLEEEKLRKKESELGVLSKSFPDAERLKELQRQIENLQTELEHIDEQENLRKQYLKELEDVTLQLGFQTTHAEKQRKEQQRQQIAQDLIKIFGNEVYGTLKSLCVPISEEYTLPGIRVLKKWQNAFVVDTEETAIKCIDYLKRNKLPRQKFLPANVLRTRHVTPEIEAIVDNGEAQLIRQCFRERKANESVAKALDFVCGTILVCKDANTANKIAFSDKNRMLTTVALDGTFFNKNGRIAGGKSELENLGDIFNASQIANMERRKMELLKLLKEIPSLGSGYDKKRKIEALKNQIKEIERNRSSRIREREKQAEVVHRQVEEIRTSVEEKRKEFDSVDAILRNLESQKEDLQRQKDELAQTIFENFCKKLGIADLEVFRTQFAASNERIAQKEQTINAQLEALRAEAVYVSQLKSNDYEKMKKKFDDLKMEVDKMREKEQDKREMCDDLHVKFVKAQEEHETVSKELDNLNAEYETAKEKVKEIKSISKKLEKLEEEKRTVVDELLSSIQSIFFECQVKNISLPLKRGRFEDVEIFEGGESTEESSPSMGSVKLSPQNCKADYSVIEAEIEKIVVDEERGKLLEKMTKEITEIEKQIVVKEAGVTSVADYNERITRARETEKVNLEKFNTLGRTLQEKKKALDNVKANRRKLFMDTFKKMQRDVDYYYKLLYDNHSAQAALNLAGSGEPYECKVDFKLIVPGKQQASVEQLSGGEKSMACLALLLAGKPEKVNCILMDEFDAALDRNNVHLVAELCDTLSLKSFQFIIVSHLYESFAHANYLFGGYSHCPKGCRVGTCISMLDCRAVTDQHGEFPDPDEEARKLKAVKGQFRSGELNTSQMRRLMNEQDQFDDEDFFLKSFGNFKVGKFIRDKKEENRQLGGACVQQEELREIQEIFEHFTIDRVTSDADILY